MADQLRYYENFDDSLSVVNTLWKNYRSNSVNTDISPEDDMYGEAWDPAKSLYISTGENALCVIAKAMLLANSFNIKTILDMPCGFGRVMRHVRLAFPQAKIYGCDLYDNRINYCAENFGSLPFKSQEDFNAIEFPEKFDLIWCGSLLTHLPEPLFNDAFRLFSRALADNGIAIVTVLGRISPYIQRNKFEYLTQEAFKFVEDGLKEKGFGYADYNMQETFNEQNSYGIAVVTPSFLMSCLEDDDTIQICGYIESGWVEQQDVVILKKTPVNCW